MQNRLNKITGYLLSLILLLLPAVSVHAQNDLELLKIGITKDENTLTPYTYVTGSPGLDLVHLVYDTLFQLDEENQPQPWLVKDYQVSNDGLTYSFQLHQNVKWHDGKLLTADDVKFTYEYVLKHKKPRFTKPAQSVESITVKDPSTLIMKLKQHEPDFMVQSLADLPILPKHIWSQVENPDKAAHALGSGPYIMEEYKPGQYYKLKANVEYFKGEPIADLLVLPIIEDPTALYTALKAGEVDAVSGSIAPELVEEFKTHPNIKLVNGTGFATTLLQINTEKYPLSIKEVRQAMAYAIDTKSLIDTVMLGYAAKGNPGFIHPSSPSFNQEISFSSDMQKGKQLLDSIGFKDTDGDGFREDSKGKKFTLDFLTYSNNPIRIRTAEMIMKQFKELGINVSVRSLDMNTVDSLVWPEFDVSKGRDFDLAMWGWSSAMQLFPSRLVDLFHSDPHIGTANIGGYKSKELDQLAEKLNKTLDPKEREQLIRQMQSLIAREFPIIPLYYQEIINAYNPNVNNHWVFQSGKGIMNKLSFIFSEEHKENKAGNTPAASDGKAPEMAAQTTSGKPIVSLIVLGIATLALVIMIIGFRQSKKKL